MFKLRPTIAALTKLLFFLSLLFSLSIFGQDRNPAKFGKISAADLKTKSYNIHNNASAVVIADIGSSQVVGNLRGWFSIEFKHFKRIHILKKGAYDLANVEILLYTDGTGEEQLKDLKAHTYNLENGKLIESKVDLKSSVYRSVVDKNHSLRKFVFPAVKEGSIIEYEYTISSDFIFNLQPWKFQGSHPVLWSEYNISIPEFLYYVFFQQGDFKKTQTARQANFRVTDTRTAGRSTTEPFIATVNDYRMVMRNVPAMKLERFTSSLENHIAKIEFQLAEYRSPLTFQTIMGDWTDVTETLLNDENFGGQLRKDNSWLNDEIKIALQGAKTDEEKARNIFKYAQKNLNCTNHNRLYTDQPLKNVLKNKSGNEAEINLLLVAMLRKAGLKADPLLLSTKSHGYAYSNYPIIDRFNYVVCRAMINDKPVYLDASRPNLGFGRLDWDCYNGHARVINEEATPVDLLSDSLIETKTTSLVLGIENGSKILGTVQQMTGYYESLSIRDIISENGFKQFVEEITNDKPADVEIEDFRVDYLPDLDDPVQISYNLELKLEKKDIIYVDPMFGEGFTENPFTAIHRIYPVEMPYTLDETFIARIEVPKEYRVDELPKPARMNLDVEGKSFFEYLIQNSGGVILLRTRVKVHRSYFLPEEYKMLRDFFSVVVNKQNEKIVLRKIK